MRSIPHLLIDVIGPVHSLEGPELVGDVDRRQPIENGRRDASHPRAVAGRASPHITHRRPTADNVRHLDPDAGMPHRRLALLLQVECGQVAHVLVGQVRRQRLHDGARAVAGFDVAQLFVGR